MQGRMVSRELTMLIALAAIWIFFAVQQPAFLSPRNLSLLMIELSVTAILALGMLLVLLPGQIDLSAGSGVGLTGAVAAVLVYWSGVPGADRAAGRGGRGGAGVGRDGLAHRGAARAGVHHHARRSAGVQGTALDYDPQPDRADRRGREYQCLLTADHVLPAAGRRIRTRGAWSSSR